MDDPFHPRQKGLSSVGSEQQVGLHNSEMAECERNMDSEKRCQEQEAGSIQLAFISFAIGQLDEIWIEKIQKLEELVSARLIDSTDLGLASFSDDESKTRKVGLPLCDSDIYKCAYIPALLECMEGGPSFLEGESEKLFKKYNLLLKRMKLNLSVIDQVPPSDRIKKYFHSEMARILAATEATLVLDSRLETDDIVKSIAVEISGRRFALIRLVDRDSESPDCTPNSGFHYQCSGAILVLNRPVDCKFLLEKIEKIRKEKEEQRALSKEIRVNITTNGKLMGTYDIFAEAWKQNTISRHFQQHLDNILKLIASDSEDSILRIELSEIDEVRLERPVLISFRTRLSDDEAQNTLSRIEQVQQSVTFEIETSCSHWQLDAKPESVASPARLREPRQKEQQEHVASRIVGRMVYLLGQKGKAVQQFSRLRFIVLVPNFTTLRDQTIERLKRGVDPSLQSEAVIFYHENCRRHFADFRQEAMKESNSNTLFVIVADEAHYAIVKGAAHDKFVNDSDNDGLLLSRPNLFILQVSATPYNLLTRSSRLPAAFVTKFGQNHVPEEVCDEKPCDGAEELHVVRWYPSVTSAGSQGPLKSEYLRLEDFFRTVYTNQRYLAAGILRDRRPIIAQLIRDDGWLSSILAKTSKERDYVLAVDYLFSLLYFSVFRWNLDKGCLKPIDIEQFNHCLVRDIPLFRKHFEYFTGSGPAEFNPLETIRAVVYRKIIEDFGNPDAHSDSSDEDDAGDVQTDVLEQALKNLFSKKLQAECNARAGCAFTVSDDNSPSFSETDRIVLDLLDIDEDSGRGRMKMIRIKDKAHGDFFLKVIKAVVDIMFAKSARHFQSEKETGPPFAVIGDWGAKFHASITKQAPDFVRMVLASGSSVEDIKRGQPTELAVDDDVVFYNRAGQLEGKVLELLDNDTVRVSVRSQEGSQPREMVVARDDVEISRGRDILYSDLEGMPCILVLCEKGRMGDTFPQSLNCMDLRTRASEKLMTLVQELGRSCRYPKREGEGLEFCGIFGPRDKAEALFKAGKAVAVHEKQGGTFVGYASHWEPFGGLAVVETSGGGILQAFDQISAEVAFKDCVLKRQIRNRDHVRVSLRLGQIIFDVQVEAPEGLCQGDSVSELKGKIVLYAAGDADKLQSEALTGANTECRFLTDTTSLIALLEARSHCQITPLSNDVPYILLKKEVMDCVLRAAKKADEEGLEIWECLKLKGGLDSYMKLAGKAKSTKDLHDYRNEYLAQSQAKRNLSFDLFRGSGSDLSKHRHHNRLLLFAECQIGKTGAYCAVLRQLSERIAQNQNQPDAWLPRVPLNPEILLALKEKSRIKWALPYWRDVAEAKWKVQVKAGKYHSRVRGQRLAALLRASQKGEAWMNEYVRLVRNEELVMASDLQRRIESLKSSVAGQLACPLSYSPSKSEFSVLNEGLLISCIDWDSNSNDADGSYSVFFEGRKRDRDFKPLVIEGCTRHIDKNDYSIVCKGLEDLSQRLSVQTLAWGAGAELAERDLEDGAAPYRYESKVFSGEDPVAHVVFLGVAGASKFNERQLCLPGCSLFLNLNGEPQAVTLSVPEAYASLFSMSDDNTMIGVRQFCPDGADQDRWLKHWIFTPTYNRHSNSPAPALLDRGSAYEGVMTVSVLLVREGEQFKAYQADCGGRYIIIALPPRMDLSGVATLDRVAWATGTQLCVESGGVGYARLFAQLLADKLHLGWIWMLDDNVHYCQRMNLRRMFASTEPRHAELELCSFASVMREIEAQLGSDDDETYTCPIEGVKLRIRDAVAADTVACPKGASLRTSSGGGFGAPSRGGGTGGAVTVRRDFSGDSSRYGVIGLRRDAHNYQDLRGPFAVTHSVYSFVLLNVRETVLRGALYPPKSFWEDIEFNRLCEERGLAVLKCNRFFHFKKNLQRRAGRTGVSPTGGSSPPCAVLVTVLPSAADDGEAVFDVALQDDTDSYASAMMQIQQALEARKPGCLIVRVQATPRDTAQQPIELAPATPPPGYLPLANAEVWLMPALGDSDRIELREGPSPELAEHGPLAALRAWFEARGLKPEGGPGVFTWPPDGDEDECKPAYDIARSAREFRGGHLQEGSCGSSGSGGGGGDSGGGECVVVLRAFRSDGRDGLEGLLHRFTNRMVQSLVRALDRVFLVVPALLLTEGEPAAAPSVRGYIEKVALPALAHRWLVGGVWTGRRAEGGCLPVYRGTGGGEMMEDGCFLLILLNRMSESPVMPTMPATPVSGGCEDASAGGKRGWSLTPPVSLKKQRSDSSPQAASPEADKAPGFKLEPSALGTRKRPRDGGGGGTRPEDGGTSGPDQSAITGPVPDTATDSGEAGSWCELINVANNARTLVQAPVFCIGRRRQPQQPQLAESWLFVDHINVSRLHCAVIRSGVDGAGPVIIDLSSAGTFLNGDRVQQRPDPPPGKETAAALALLAGEAAVPRADGGGWRWATLRNRDRISLAGNPVFTVQLGTSGPL